MNPTIMVLIAVAALAVLAGVAFVVMGKGGELARFEADHPPLDLPTDRQLTSSDMSRVALPLALWGYHVRAVDELLVRLSAALDERDARIAELERRVSDNDTSTGPRLLYPRTAPTPLPQRTGASTRLENGAPADTEPPDPRSGASTRVEHDVPAESRSEPSDASPPAERVDPPADGGHADEEPPAARSSRHG
ncbi:hypothetical protein [Nocardiopsis gilva]|uniref:hypothetical protein n=1 Tax=Nocardiopsis gilva TaxID=280236 RepID=UPI001E4A117A|nr:hypothetical protein [Nocardiopsis gilva]